MTATKSLRGAVGSIALTDVLLTLQNTGSTGLLRVEREGVSRDLWLASGTLVAAESSAGSDSLEWLLVTAGVISQDRCDRVRERIDAGGRRGPALVEAAGLSPAQLCQWTERRARFLTRDVIGWKTGEFTFEEGALPPAGAIPVALMPREVLLGALRDPAAAFLLEAGRPVSEAIPIPADRGLEEGLLQPEERYVLSLTDGKRSAGDIASLSEIGAHETALVLSRLALTGFVSLRGIGPSSEVVRQDEASIRGDERQPAAGPGAQTTIEEWIVLPAGDSHNALRAILVAANRMFVAAGVCMVRDIGPIAEHLLEKALRDARAQHPALFQRVAAARDGSLPEETMIRNLGMLKESKPRLALVSGLDAYLCSILNVVRRFLGPEHESSLVRLVKEELR